MNATGDEPQVRILPSVQAQLDAARPPQLFGLPARTAAGLDTETIRLMHTSVLEAEARAWAAGHQLGPLTFTHELGPHGYRVTCSAEILPRGDRSHRP